MAWLAIRRLSVCRFLSGLYNKSNCFERDKDRNNLSVFNIIATCNRGMFRCAVLVLYLNILIY